MPNAVRIRMYRVGFGDCFLISFPGPRHMLLDCGTLRARDNGRLADVMDDVIRTTGGRIHVVVASHRHRDHVSGFSLDTPRWNGVEVEEVWLPWTEDAGDPEAIAARGQMDRIAQKLARLERDPLARLLAANSVTDDAAMDVLTRGFKGNPRRLYLDPAASLASDALPGVHAQVLGPRKSDEERRRIELECNLLQLSVDSLEIARRERKRGPFPGRFLISTRRARKLLREPLGHADVLEPEDEPSLVELCYRIDKMVGGTSLILVLRYGRVRMLLAGDATGECWTAFHEHAELAAALPELDFYKVSHHGSHNGTPPRILEMLAGESSRRGGRAPSSAAPEGTPPELVRDPLPPRKKTLFGMVSCEGGVADEIPAQSVLRRLRGRKPVARSDTRAGQRGYRSRPLFVEVEIPA